MKWLAAFVLLILTCVVTYAATPSTRPTTAIPREGCVTAECHANVKNFKVLHGPVGELLTRDKIEELLSLEFR